MQSTVTRQQEVSQNIRTLLQIMESRNKHFVPHAKRVLDVVTRMSEVLSLPRSTQQIYRTACLLHDVGEIALPDELLLKSEPLTDEELKHVQRHVIIGEQIVKGLLHNQMICALVRHHHERFDGSGYPDGLRGQQIPLGARVLSVAEAFTAMTEGRSYRQARSAQEAVAEILSLGRRQFCPQAASTLAACFDFSSHNVVTLDSGPTSAAETSAVAGLASSGAGGEFARNIDRQIQQIAELRPLPAVASEVLALKTQDDIKTDVLADKIRYDPALVTKLLRVANSVLYRGRTAIDSVEQAVIRLGMERVREMIVALGIIDQWQNVGETCVVSMESFWRHSVATAIIGQRLAKSCQVPGVETVFTAGLIHDVGTLVLQEAMGAAYESVLQEAADTGANPAQVEGVAIGVDHAAVLNKVGQCWNLPEPVLRLIADHHRHWPDLRGVSADMLRQIICLRVANILANTMANLHWNCGSLESLPATHVRLLRLDPAMLTPLLEEIPEEIESLAEAYGLNLPDRAEDQQRSRTSNDCLYYVCETAGEFDPLPLFLRGRGVEVIETREADEAVINGGGGCWIRISGSAAAEKALKVVRESPAEQRSAILVILAAGSPRSVQQQFAALKVRCVTEPCATAFLEHLLASRLTAPINA